MTIRTRLTVWYGLTLLVLVALVGIVVWWQVETSLHESIDRELRIHAFDVAAGLEAGSDDLEALTPPGLGIFSIVIDPSTATTVGSPGAPTGLSSVPEGSSRRSLSDEGPSFALYRVTLPDGRQLITGSPLAAVERSAERIPELLIGAGAALALAALVGGWWLAGSALRPIRRLTREADAIGPHELDRRLPALPQHDEVGALAATINRLLDRIEEAIVRERSFIAGAAHDLRTPTAALRLRLDALSGAAVQGAVTAASIEDLRRDVVNLGDLADALLGLAAAQTPGPADAVADHVLPLLVARAEEEVEWLAHERGIRIEHVVDELSVRVSATRFHQALSNLLSNAVRHGPADATVWLVARVRARGADPDVDDGGESADDIVVAVEVIDEGEGIAPEDRDRLFLPFGTAPSGPGSHGLGLATVAAAVRAQHGRFGYRVAADGRSVFWFELPVGQPRARSG